MIEDEIVTGDEIPLTNTSSGILERVLVFLEKHVEKERDEDEEKELKKWDEEFVEELKGDKGYPFGMILAANFLAAKSLLDVACQNYADMLKDKSHEWIREYAGIENDFTLEEEAELRAENSWAYE
ncbi:hypothetical protein MKW98_023227 [Papaver atlanticum]|uniref:SKP1-like protein n=1 Tax=Papaver atlanticum TaxID=357466 RepID=A0AAD4TDW3_9MAGN|nr:hypothetical protein MKW98_023227 [Papaver atlanticum]